MLQLSNKMPRRGYEPPEAGTIQEIVQMDNSRCGTTAGYWWHYNHKEEICLPCKEARRKNQRDNHKYKSLALVNPTNSTFDKRCGTNSGHQAHRKRNELSCEPCHNAYLEYHRKRYAKNPDKIKKQQLNWKLKNSKKYEINKKNYYAKNYIKLKQSNTEKERRRRAVKLNTNIKKYTDKEVLELYGNICHICNIKIDLSASRWIGRGNWQMGLHIDHVIPLAKNGSDTLDNVRPAHAICNLSKGGK